MPALFTDNQKNATKQAAKLAGFEQCELIEEPIAVSMAYGMTSFQDDDSWMVFDFNGGSFSVTLLKAEDGIIRLVDTEGNNRLGGKDLDYAIVDNIIIPYLKDYYGVASIFADDRRKIILREALKTYAEDIQNKLSFQDKEDLISNFGELGEDEDGDEIALDLTVTKEQAFDAMRPIFQKAVDICKNLLERNNMSGSQLKKIILAGGSTRSPLLQQMLSEQITKDVDMSIDPLTVFAHGAAIFASTIDADLKSSDVEIGTIRLSVGYEATSVETTEWVSIQLDKAATGTNCPNKVFVELVSSDMSWSSGKTEIDANGNVVEAHLQEGKDNYFSIMTYDEQGTALACLPNEIIITQRTKNRVATLPYYLCTCEFNDVFLRVETIPIKGLEKGNLLPASGKLSSLKYRVEITPDDEEDTKIPLFQVDSLYLGQDAWLCENVAEIIISGKCLDFIIPEDTAIDITIDVDSSELITAKAIIPDLGRSFNPIVHYIPKVFYDGDFKYKIQYGYDKLNKMLKDGLVVGTLYSELKSVDIDIEKIPTALNRNARILNIKEVLRKIDKLDNETILERRKINLIKGMAKARELRELLYNVYSRSSLSVIERDAKLALETDDPKLIRKVLSQVDGFIYNQKERIKKDEALKNNSVLLDINIVESSDLHKAFTSISIDKNSDYDMLSIQICEKVPKSYPKQWVSEVKKIDKIGGVIVIDIPSSFGIEYEIFAYTESGSPVSVYPSIIQVPQVQNKLK